jgi:hypothetical protein
MENTENTESIPITFPPTKQFDVRPKIEQLIDYLTFFAKIQASQNKESVNGYFSLYDFVLKNGRAFAPAPLPKIYYPGVPRSCFENAALLALAHDDLIYVEGYAAHIFPTEHAWCVNQKGRVVDNTWDEPKHSVYYGIPFKTSFLEKHLIKTKVYGVIGCGNQAVKLIETPVNQWKQKI